MYIKVRVKTGAKNELISAVSRDHFEISVRQKPEQNMANRRIVELVALQFALSAKKVRIVSGHHSPSKILSVDVPDEAEEI